MDMDKFPPNAGDLCYPFPETYYNWMAPRVLTRITHKKEHIWGANVLFLSKLKTKTHAKYTPKYE